MTQALAIGATHCAVCGRPLTDVFSAELGIGPDCRRIYGFDAEVEPAVRAEANTLVYTIATAKDQTQAQQACVQLYAIGFVALAERIERRLRRIEQHAASIVPHTGFVAPADNAAVAPATEPTTPLPFTLTDGQAAAMDMVGRLCARTEYSVGVIVGFAGTGKTTLLRAIAQTYGRSVIITPTGRAALRVREATGLFASTIHRWMYMPVEDPVTGNVTFQRREPNEVEHPPSGLVILDEASMVGPDVWEDITKICVHVDLKILVVGDGFQLPPFLPKSAAPFSLLTPEFAATVHAERAELTEVLRQAQDSPVIRSSMRLRQGGRMNAFEGLHIIGYDTLRSVSLATYKAGGVIICHRNATRFRLNNGMRHALDIQTEHPQDGEPLMVLKNTYAVGLVNGETTPFTRWAWAPDERVMVVDKWRNKREEMRFGAVDLDDGVQATIASEELQAPVACGTRAIATAAARWARSRGLFLASGNVIPHLHVNFGYAYTAHKCVHPDTLVETPRGLERIKDIPNEGVIATPEGPRPYRNKMVNRSGKMLRIVTKDGYSIDVTPDHGCNVWNGEKFDRVDARDVKPGAVMRISLKSRCPWRGGEKLPPAPDVSSKAVKRDVPPEMTDDLAEFLGLMVADGHVTLHGRLLLAKRHEEVVDRFRQLLRRLFGMTSTKIPRYAGTCAWGATGNSMVVAAWLRQLGGMAPHDKYVPAVILRSSEAHQRAFLRGLFEDGAVNTKQGKFDHVEWSNESLAVVLTVQTMLARLGIISTCDRGRCRLYIYNEGAARFRAEIGFISKMKQQRLPRKATSCRYSMPLSQTLFRALFLYMTEFEKNNTRISMRLSRPKAVQLKARVSPELRVVLDDLLTWHYTPVESIRRTKAAPSMCVEVPGVGRFLQNGLDFLNSQGSQWPYVLVVLESSVRLNEEEGRRWAYTAITRAQQMTAVYFGDI